MYKKSKRFIAGFLAFLLVVTMVPADMLSVVYAEEPETMESQMLEDDDNDNAVLENVTTDDDLKDAKADDDDAVPENDNDLNDEGDSESTSKVELTDDVDEVTEDEVEVTETVTKREVVEEKTEKETDNKDAKLKVLSADDVPSDKVDNKATTENLTVGDFILTAGVAIDGTQNAKNFTVTEDIVSNKKLSIKNRIKLGGNGDDSKNSIAFTVSDGTIAKITVCGVTSNSQNAAMLYLYDSENTEVKKDELSVTQKNDGSWSSVTTTITWEDISAGSYYIASTTDDSHAGNGNLYYVRVDEKAFTPKTLSGVTLTGVDNKTYTGADFKPTISVTDSDNESVPETGYTVTYSRESNYSEVTEDFKSAGTIYVKVKGAGTYAGELTDSYTIAKADYPTGDDATMKTAATKGIESSAEDEQTVNLNELFGIPATENATYTKGTVTNEDSLIEDGDDAITITGSTLKFTPKTLTNSSATATIKINVTLRNYVDTELTLTINITEKTELTIKYAESALTKTYDGAAFEYAAANVTLKEGENAFTDTENKITESLKVTYKKGEETIAAPVNAGDYKMTIAIPDTNNEYKGTVTVDVKINKKDIELKASQNLIYVKGYINKPETTAPQNSIYYNYKDINDALIMPETVEAKKKLDTLLKSVDVKMTYKSGETEITNWDTVEPGEVTVVPSMVIKTEGENVDQTALDNYNIVVPTEGADKGIGKLTVRAAEEPLADGVHELNLTKNWAKNNAGSGWAYKGASADNDTNTDGYFTVTADLKTAGVNNSTPLYVYDKYTNVAKMKTDNDATKSKIVTFATTKANAKVEVIVALPDSGNVTIGDQTITANANNTITGTKVYPTNAEPNTTMVKAEVTIGAAGNYAINGNKEFQLLYVKVTESDGGGDTSHTVNFYDGSTLFDTKTVTTGSLDLSTVTPPTKDGYTFKGWATTATATAPDVTGTITVTADRDLYAVWEDDNPPAPEGYKLTFMNGTEKIDEKTVTAYGSFDFSSVDTTKLTAPAGKKFVGWGTSATATEVILPTASIKTVRRDRTFYAIFIDESANLFTVTLEGADGEELDTYNVVPNGTFTFPEWYSDKAEDFDFDGWKVKGGAATDPVYKAETTSPAVTANITYVETWKEKVLEKFKVTLVKEDGSKITEEEVEEGKEFTFPATTTQKQDWFFAGWKTEDDDHIYGAGEKYEVWGNVTFKETWTQGNAQDFTVTFKMSDWETEFVDLKKTIKAGDNPVITMPATPTKRVGFKFNGWYNDDNGNIYEEGASYPVTKNVVFYEEWDYEEYENGMYVHFNSEGIPTYQGGTAVTPEVEVYYGSDELTLGKDYTVKFKNNKNAGLATLTVTGKGNFAKAKKDYTFTINRKSVEEFGGYSMTVIKDAKVSPVLMYNGKALKLNKDFKLVDSKLNAKGAYAAVTTPVEYEADGVTVKDGTGPNTLKVEGIGNYTGSTEISVTVVEKGKENAFGVDLVDKKWAPVYGDSTEYGYLFTNKKDSQGNEIVPNTKKIKVFDKKTPTKELVEDTDFTVIWNNADTVGEVGATKFTVVGMGAYVGSVTKSFKVLPKAATNIEAGVWTYDTTSNKNVVKSTDLSVPYSSTGSTLDSLVVRYKREGVTTDNSWDYVYLEENVDYKVSYSNNKKVTTTKKAAAKITFIGNYKGTAPKTVEFAITGASIDYAYVVAPDMVYTKEGKYVSKPFVGYYYGPLLKASDYTVSYKWAKESDIKIENGQDKTDYKADDKVNIKLDATDNYAVVKVVVKPKEGGNYQITDTTNTTKTIEGTYYVRKAEANKTIDLSKAKVEFFSDKDCKNQYKKIPYCGEEFYTPEGNKVTSDNKDDINKVFVKVTVKGESAPVDANLYDVIWLNATEKGKATVLVVGKGVVTTGQTKAAIGSKTASITIDSIGEWKEPKTNVNARINAFLEKLF